MNQSTIGTHDPTILFDEKTNHYYMYSTDTELDGTITKGIQIRKSKDGVNWEYLSTAFNGIPESVYEYTNPSNLWAPDVIKHDDQYLMYYSASIFGTNKSCINLATAPTPEGPWVDRGLVIKTNPNVDKQNAIDANVFFDRDEKMWMVYGSFFSGIYVVEMDPKTYLIKSKDDIGTCIARRTLNVEGAIEGPFIYYHKDLDMYYLFTSYDFLHNTYNIRVAASKNVQGPYLDIAGNTMFGAFEMPHSNGSKILGSYHIDIEPYYISIGHNSILDVQGKQYLVAHARLNGHPHKHYLFKRELIWLDNGWPVPAFGEVIKQNQAFDYDKEYELVFFDKTNNQIAKAQNTKLNPRWKMISYTTCVDQKHEVLGISGIDENNQIFFGYQKGAKQ